MDGLDDLKAKYLTAVATVTDEAGRQTIEASDADGRRVKRTRMKADPLPGLMKSAFMTWYGSFLYLMYIPLRMLPPLVNP